MEKFGIPGAAGIIEKIIDGEKYILIQKREKIDAPLEKGLIEIPAGKIREFEDIFDCLRREVFEETGLIVSDIKGEEKTSIVKQKNYTVRGFEPYYVSQNTTGTYPIMILTFICKADGKLKSKSNESKDIKWCPIEDIKKELLKNPDAFYSMHILALKKYLNISTNSND